jgi:hypothetical protein
MEVEVVSPVVRLSNAASGANRYTFTEDWWLTRMVSPVLDVTPVGAQAGHMVYDPVGQRLSGQYGVFYEGTAKAAFYQGGALLAEGAAHPVTPLRPFNFDEIVVLPTGTDSVALRVFDGNGALLGTDGHRGSEPPGRSRCFRLRTRTQLSESLQRRNGDSVRHSGSGRGLSPHSDNRGPRNRATF